MLKRASRIAAALMKMNPAAQPILPCPFRPHSKARTAGAAPNEITSASESNSTPNALVVFVSRAMRPSSMSSTMAMPMKGAACSSRPPIEYTMHA